MQGRYRLPKSKKKIKRKIKEEQKHKHLNVSSGLTSLCRLMKHLTRSPPIEWVIMFILFSPAAVYIDSNFSARRFNVSWNLKEQMNYLTRTRNHHNVGIDNGENTFLVHICEHLRQNGKYILFWSVYMTNISNQTLWHRYCKYYTIH